MIPTSHALMTGPEAIHNLITDLRNEKHSLRITAYVLRLAKYPGDSDARASWQQLSAALLGSPARGLDCRLLICNPAASGSMGRIDETSRRALIDAGWQVRLTERSRLLHAKTYTFAHGPIWIGSHNLSAVSWLNNHEASVRSIDPAITAGHDRWFSNLWHRGITP